MGFAAILSSLMLVAVAVPAYAQDPIRVYVFAAQPEFVDESSEGLTDSAKDIRKALRKFKAITFVEHPEDAQVLLEVVSRKKVGLVWRRVSAVVRVGDYETDITGQSDTIYWGQAAKKVAGQFREWVENNADRVKAQGSNSTNSHVASAQLKSGR